jgi:hypothetical protein
MIPIQTRVFDTLQNCWLEGDSVLNLFTHPDHHTTETLSVYLSEPSRYKIMRWTGELLTDGSKVFVGDILIEPRDNSLFTVQESGSRVFIKDVTKPEEYALQYVLAATPTLTHTGFNLLDTPDPCPPPSV